jgi:hypothetical protein
MTNNQINFITKNDKAERRVLFNGYADFYHVPMDDGLAGNVRACPRSLGGCDVAFLDDMYVSPSARGSRAADALFVSLRALAAQRGWPKIRWIT